MWTYSQSTGRLLRSGQYIATGYSGANTWGHGGEPVAGTNTWGRGGFAIHGDNQGCIILPRLFREDIDRSGDSLLEVV